VGIGGINQSNANSVIQKGADGIAVVSEICSSEDPFLNTKKLYDEIKGGNNT